ncbi:MAG: hypothetical protein E7294_14535 [Lachnospiraceae bacterium]|nr:hypothetical protein [Lachnospiraceae bacterium]
MEKEKPSLNKKMIVAGMYFCALLMTTVYVSLRVMEYTKFKEIDISSYKNKTKQAICNIENLTDSEYIIIDGYCYLKNWNYSKIKYKLILQDQKTEKCYEIPTMAVNRPDVMEKYSEIGFEKIGFSGRASKRAGKFGDNYYEILFAISKTGKNWYIVHSGQYMGTN